jgi:hypothetical protein
MMMTDRKTRSPGDPAQDGAIERLLAEMRADPPEPSAALLARVMDDAMAAAEATAMPIAAPVAAPVAAPRRAVRSGRGASVWSRAAIALGGWGSVGGMLTATVAGLWIGFSGAAASDTLSAVWPRAAELGSVELLPGLFDIVSEDLP